MEYHIYPGNQSQFTLDGSKSIDDLVMLVDEIINGSDIPVKEFDGIIIGGGGAGMRASLQLAESGLNTIQRRESGLIVENKLGPANFETGEQDEVSTIYFHTAVKSQFHPEVKEKDPEIHEVSYKLQENIDTKAWEFIRREDFYIDSNIRKGGKSFVLSESVTSFNLQLLESETALAGGGYKEKWTTEWDSDESMVGGCDDPSIKENFCLPRAIKLTMSIKGHDGNILTDSQVSNFCVPPCNTEIFK